MLQSARFQAVNWMRRKLDQCTVELDKEITGNFFIRCCVMFETKRWKFHHDIFIFVFVGVNAKSIYVNLKLHPQFWNEWKGRKLWKTFKHAALIWARGGFGLWGDYYGTEESSDCKHYKIRCSWKLDSFKIIKKKYQYCIAQTCIVLQNVSFISLDGLEIKCTNTK